MEWYTANSSKKDAALPTHHLALITPGRLPSVAIRLNSCLERLKSATTCRGFPVLMHRLRWKCSLDWRGISASLNCAFIRTSKGNNSQCVMNLREFRSISCATTASRLSLSLEAIFRIGWAPSEGRGGSEGRQVKVEVEVEVEIEVEVKIEKSITKQCPTIQKTCNSNQKTLYTTKYFYCSPISQPLKPPLSPQ